MPMASFDLNRITYNQYLQRLQNYALNMFEWTGLPTSVNERFLEMTMLTQGQICFFEDKEMGFLALPVTVAGKLNIYNEPIMYRVISVGYPAKEVSPDEAVVMYNNLLRNPTMPILEAYAYRLYEVERTLDVNIKAQKTPILIKGSPQQMLTLKNLYMKYEGNEHMMFGDKNLDITGFDVLQTTAPFVADKLMLYKHDLWNECMSYLGIGNGNTDKKERLVEAEVGANDEQIESSRFVALTARKQACERINTLFPELNVDVKFRLAEIADVEGGENNESGD